MAAVTLLSVCLLLAITSVKRTFIRLSELRDLILLELQRQEVSTLKMLEGLANAQTINALEVMANAKQAAAAAAAATAAAHSAAAAALAAHSACRYLLLQGKRMLYACFMSAMP